jgi:exosortase
MDTMAWMEIQVQEKPPLQLRELVHNRLMLVLCACAVAALAIAYKPTFIFWWSRWFEKESYYSHAPFVPLGSVFIIWFNRKTLARVEARPSALGFALMAPAAALGWFAWMGASASVLGFTLPVFLLGAVIATAGVAAARSLLFPIFFLYFAAVLPESVLTALSFKAQMLSVKLASVCLRLIGVGAVSRGAFVELPGITVDVAGACSGFRLVVSMLAIAAFFAYIRRGAIWGKVAMIAFSLPLSLVINSVRIAAIAMVGQRWGESALRAAHDWTGYTLLIVTAGALLTFARIVGCGKYREMPLA